MTEQSAESAAIYDRWSNRQSILEPEPRREGDTERVFKVGYQYSVTIPDDPTQPARVASLYRHWVASGNEMPNIEVRDGELRVPVEDLTGLVLRRIPAEELAEVLWMNDQVRDRFSYCMAERYAGDAMTDEDRREFLRRVREAIHSVALDEAITKLNKLEEAGRTFSNYYRFKEVELGHYKGLFERYKETLQELRELGHIDDAQLDRRLKLHTTPDDLKAYITAERDPTVAESVGPQWTDSRNFWRDKLAEHFPPPPKIEQSQDEIA